ncbi:sigma-54-dependent transcriptional regulator [Planctomycetes bacterium K23_9]|uniref:DNA-binding transcriptional regulator NtrC n=1 Tax=Stieleria marina TaxID=1930275 RepID=A0A517NQQ5_9BACT|nr:Nitrogen regulation protein NR(I) [Planctomycetes bacterium K23_9]
MNQPSYVLVVDDEPAICWGFEQLLGDQGHTVVTASSAEEGLQKATLHRYSLVLLDVRLPGEDGISALPKFREATSEAPIIVMTAFGDLQTAVGAVQNGATDYLTKPFRLDDADKVCRQAMQTTKVETDDQPASQLASDASLLVGQSAVMQQVFHQIALVADSDLPVLITGESGTGKELVASAVHRHSQRSDQAFLTVAPVSPDDAVIESELFGHVQGAFTGAGVNRPGVFALADSGTLVMDEVDRLPLALQVKLLRVLERSEYTAVGDVKPQKCNVRCIATTSCDLEQAVREGRFREDLFRRLSAVSIEVRPLRSRPEDIPLLCNYFLRRLGAGSSSSLIDADAMQQLQQQKWHGNVRELQVAIEHASLAARGRQIVASDFPLPQNPIGQRSQQNGDSIGDAIQAWAIQQLGDDTSGMTDLHEKFLAVVEPSLLKVVLQHTDGNRAAAAELLGIHRGTLRDRLKRYGVD